MACRLTTVPRECTSGMVPISPAGNEYCRQYPAPPFEPQPGYLHCSSFRFNTQFPCKAHVLPREIIPLFTRTPPRPRPTIGRVATRSATAARFPNLLLETPIDQPGRDRDNPLSTPTAS